MKRISNSDLLIGLEYPNQEVQKAYLTYALKKRLTSKNYCPQSFDEIRELYALVSPKVKMVFDGNVRKMLPPYKGLLKIKELVEMWAGIEEKENRRQELIYAERREIDRLLAKFR